MTYHPVDFRRKCLLTKAALVVSACAALLATGIEGAAASNVDTPVAANAASGVKKSITLSASQVNAIKIGTVGSYRFPVVRYAPGNVSFAESSPVVQAEASMLAAAATFAVARKEFARVTTIGRRNGIAQKELEQAQADKQSSAAAFYAARDALRTLGKSDTDIQAILSAGRIDAGLPSGHSFQWITAYTDESDSPLIHVGQPVSVTISALPGQIFKGKLADVYTTINPDTHRLQVHATVPDPQHNLRPGMLAEVEIQVAKPMESAAIPANGVVREDDGSMTAWVTNDRRTFTQRTIKTGMRADGFVQVLEGLRAGEMAVTDGAIFLDNMLQSTN